MDRLEKLIYSVKYLPQILYFGSAVLILLIISIDVTLIELLIPLFIFFIYMTYLASKNYKSNEGMSGLEKLIYSVKYLPQTLYFGSLGLLGYDIYSQIFNDVEFLNSFLRFPLWIIFFLMTGFGVERYNKNKKKK